MVATAYCVIEGVATVSLRARRLRVGHIWVGQTGLRVLAAIRREVLPEDILQPLMEASSADTRLGSCTANSGGARYRWSSVVFEGEAHAILSTASSRAREAGRQLRDIFVGIVEEAAPNAIGHAGAVRPGGPWGDLRIGTGSRRGISRYGRHSPPGGLQHSQLFSMVPEGSCVGSVPGGLVPRSM